MSLNCQYCKKTFTTKGNLIKHQRSAKYCIKIQKEEGNILNDIKEFKCFHCHKTFTDKNNLIKHELNCQTHQYHFRADMWLSSEFYSTTQKDLFYAFQSFFNCIRYSLVSQKIKM